MASSTDDAGGVNVFYTGLPPYHPSVIEAGWNSANVDAGVRKDTIALVRAGYNVYVLAAGPEVAMEEIAARMKAKGVKWHITGIGMGVRTHKDPAVIRYLEDLVHLFRTETPESRLVFNSGAGSCVTSVQQRIAAPEGERGRLLGYEELFDGKHGEPLESMPSTTEKVEEVGTWGECMEESRQSHSTLFISAI